MPIAVVVLTYKRCTSLQTSRHSRIGTEDHNAPALGTTRHAEAEAPEAPVENGQRPDIKTLLREKTRRYNDLRVAYESVCRRLDSRGFGGRTERGRGNGKTGRGWHGHPKLLACAQCRKKLGVKCFSEEALSGGKPET